MSEAIDRTSRLYPDLFESNQNLLFMLKCRQFVEMINGSDSEVYHRKSGYSPPPPRPTSPIQTSVIQSTKNYNSNNNNNKTKQQQSVEEMNQNNSSQSHNGTNCSDSSAIIADDGDIEMDTTDEVRNGHRQEEEESNMSCNGNKSCDTAKNGYQNGNGSHTTTHNVSEDESCDNNDEDMDVDVPVCRKSSGKPAVQRILEFGKELQRMSDRLPVDKASSETNQKMLEVSFFLYLILVFIYLLIFSRHLVY